MSRLALDDASVISATFRDNSEQIVRRLATNLSSNCPLDVVSSFLRTCSAQSCGKCVPCRIGVRKMADLIDDMLDGMASEDDIELLRRTAVDVYETADCAIGYEAGMIVMNSLKAFADDFQSHVRKDECLADFAPIPCVKGCPAHVDVPSYIAAVKAGRNEDAIRIIRNENPFPSVCAYVCEHPCEAMCRREIIDMALNIRGIKKYAVDNVEAVPTPKPGEPTGKKIAIMGGGPSGLTCAYYLRLMGHDVTVFEKNDHLGGMLWYGIPRYRLPEPALMFDVDAILGTGVKIEMNKEFGKDLTISDIEQNFDAVYVAIGAHTAKSLGIEGDHLPGVISAVDMLYLSSGEAGEIDMADKDVVVIGGGNVAMDATRSAKRLGASRVRCLYRRRREDMTALAAEIDASIAEGVELLTLLAPVKIEQGANGKLLVTAQPQVPGLYRDGRPSPVSAEGEPVQLECDIVVGAVGQDIVSEYFAEAGFEVNRKRFVFAEDCKALVDRNGYYVGGDCATGPATVIRAIAAGKVAAFNIDETLGFKHEVREQIEVPEADFVSTPARGRVVVQERPPLESAKDFQEVELPWTEQEAMLECSRCLRCDHFGFNALREGREMKW